VDTDDVRGRLDDLEESAWALAVVSASAESGLLASLASPRRVEEAAESGGMPAEIAHRLLEVLVALGFAERTGEAYAAADGLRAMLIADGLEQLCAELRTTLLQSRDLIDRATRHQLTSGWGAHRS
jgi:DNA-binding IclR family transcriptional regulator